MNGKLGGAGYEDATHAFRVFDRDGDGLISAEELRSTMNNLGVPLTQAEVAAMIAEADTDGGDGVMFENNANQAWFQAGLCNISFSHSKSFYFLLFTFIFVSLF